MKAILSLGTNLGDRHRHIADATQALSQISTIVAVSAEYETTPWGFRSEHSFLNIAMIVDTDLQPTALLDATQAIERQLGRSSKSIDHQYSDRPIDIDIIDYDGLVIDTPRLTLPHPMAHLRNFVLYPLAEIAPQWQHPISRKSVNQLIADCSDGDSPLKL